MTLTQLRYLLALADHGHFGRAAAACGVSQPTLSAQIRKLEDRLAAPLVSRGAGGTALTPLGESVAARARRILEEADAILDMARAPAGPLRGARQLGVIPTFCPTFLPWAAPALRAAFPGLTLVLREELTGSLIDALRRGAIDWAVIADDPRESGLLGEALFDEEFLACVPAPADADGPCDAPMTQATLAQAPLLLLAEGHCLREQALGLCAAGAPGPDDARATSLETLRGLVAAGQGVTLMPRLSARADPTVRYAPLDPPAYRRLYLAFPRSAAARREAQAAAAVLRQAAPDGLLRAPDRR